MGNNLLSIYVHLATIFAVWRLTAATTNLGVVCNQSLEVGPRRNSCELIVSLIVRIIHEQQQDVYATNT